MKYLKIALYTLLSIFALIIAFFIWAFVVEYRPNKIELIYENNSTTQIVSDEFDITVWNIGYAGMSEDMDFFMDGGAQTRTTKEQTQINLKHILTTLDTISSDFFLLQEVDESSKRSYYINQYAKITKSKPNYFISKAYNFKTKFVPVPVTKPLGKAQSGLATLSYVTPKKVERHAFPSVTPLPNRMFDLKRCFMVSEYKTNNNKKLYIINTHNSAFDSGKGRKKEMEHLREVLEQLYGHGESYVIVGGDWNQVPPDYPTEPTTPQYTTYRITNDLLPDDWNVVYDKTVETVRFANKPYEKGQTITSTVDYFIVSPNVEVLEVNVFQLEFKHSDHNPVHLKVRL